MKKFLAIYSNGSGTFLARNEGQAWRDADRQTTPGAWLIALLPTEGTSE